MSKDFRHGQKQMSKAGKTRQAHHESVPRDLKGPSERRIKDTLKHAVKLQDAEAFEDYDERELT